MPQLEIMPEGAPDSTSLTLADMARQLDLAESTTRYYCKRFAPFIPVVGEGRRRRYGPEAVEVVRAVAEYMTSTRSAIAVEEALERRFPRVLDAAPPATLAPLPADTAPLTCVLPTQYVEQQTRAMQAMALGLHKVAVQQEALKRMVAVSRAIVEENKTLKQEVATLKELLHTAELVHQEDLQQIRDWIGRMLRRKPGAEPVSVASAATAGESMPAGAATDAPEPEQSRDAAELTWRAPLANAEVSTPQGNPN